MEEDMNSRKKVYVVPHSHWDREWYFTIEDSNILLSENMPYLMDVLEKDMDYTSYTFDAQLSVVEELVKIYPEEKERLKKLVSDKRIFIGPWYTQTDSILVNKESIIRNLLYGTRLGNKYGHSMKVGYLPDIFGQNAYLPSIFNGFDMEYSILQRGIYIDDLRGNLNFKWVSPDNESVGANNIFLGYGPGKFLSSDNQYIQDKLIPMLEKLESLNRDCDNLLLPCGGDQVLVRKHFPQTIKELNEKQDKYEFVLSDYETFMKDTWTNDFDNKIHGELIACEKSRIHNTIKSQRYDIKYLNTLVENKILYVLEPLSVIGKFSGISYKSRWLDIMWKLLFDAHAHDSIGGCNSDETNRDIVTRLEKVNVMCDDIINIVKKQITIAISKYLNRDNILVVFNTKNKCMNEIIEAVVFTKEKDFTINTIDKETVEFTINNQEVISGGKQILVTAEGEKEVELLGYYRTEIRLANVNVKPMGFTTLVINQDSKETADMLVVSNDMSIENDLYELIFDNNNLLLVNKSTNERIDNIVHFENCGDYGDSYDFSTLGNDKDILATKAELLEVSKSNLVQTMKLKHSIELPFDIEARKLNKKSTILEIITKIEVRNGENFIRVSHDIENTVKDHRLRVVYNTNIKSKVSLSDQGFSAITRQNYNMYLDNWKERKFAEKPVCIYGLENFVALKDNSNTFALVTKGIKEYEILEDSKIALTLYRSVGLLGRDNLAWRPGRASGINNKVVYTKDAQLLNKKLKFEYAIYYDESDEDVAELFDVTDKFINKYTTYQNQDLNLFEERLERFEIPKDNTINLSSYSLFNIDNDDVFMSVCKESYEKDGVIVRLFNPTSEAKEVSINSKYIKDIKITNLYERELDTLDSNVQIKAKGYITLKLLGGEYNE
ncbi:alpha-mannosidase [Clostridioides sp. ES-S-0056-01]|nr:alpha-mannosidase [Clostridioides sp. ES-S-0056-01]MCC0713841.1 alpha-mannosidase [Clostridioides sp. ES-S-0077-01]